MESRYDEAQAAAAVDAYRHKAPVQLKTPEAQRDLALRVYTSQLLGREPSLVLHGGGNTSVKTRAQDFSAKELDCLCVKGSGWDLASIEPAGFPVCRLDALLDLCTLSSLSDADMVKALKSQMLDPQSPTPSVEALLHAFLPAKYVDHTHADAVLALVDQPDAEVHVRRVWGERALFVPYIMPGFVLLRRVVELTQGQSPEGPMVLEKHGIFTWGDSARESYERMIEAVTRAEQYLEEKGAPLDTMRTSVTPSGSPESERRALQRRIAPLVRGALARANGGQRLLLTWQDDPATLELSARDDVGTLTQRGPLTPDHVIRTKPRPLLVQAPNPDALATFASALEEQLGRYREEYTAYFERGRARQAEPLERLDPLPRVLLFPGLGALAAGTSSKAASIVADIYQHTAKVLLAASRLGEYQPVSEADLFDIEYWSLEQAKLKRSAGAGQLTRRVALVTGAARGIGLATAQRFLTEGAHVMLGDMDAERLAMTAAELSRQFGASVVRHLPVDVTNPSDIERMLDYAVDCFGGLDLVVSNAGTAPSGLLHEAEGDEALRASLEVNLLGHQNVARAASQLLLAQGAGGVLLFNASKSAFNQGPQFGPYAVPKAALVALMKQYAVDLAPHGIRANAVNADRVRTDLFAGGVLEARARARGVSPNEYFKLNLLQRETTAADVADAFFWLATAPATTGTVIPVDGGNPAAFPR